MAAAPSKVNAVLDGIVTALQTIDSAAFPNTWLTKPLTVRRELKVRSLTIEARPVIAVELDTFHDEWKGAGWHECTATVAVYLIVSGDQDNAEKTVINLMRDVQLALITNEVLPGIAGTVQIMTLGETFDYETDYEIQGRVGLAFATLRFPVRFRFDHTAP
jgi:hypothetical protein